MRAVTSGCADAAGRNPRAGRAHRALGQARAWGQAIRRAGGLRYLQVIPVAVLLWALDAVDRFRGGARAAGLAHAGVVSEMSSLAGGAVALPVNHWLAGHAGLGAIAAGYYIVLHGLAAGVTGLLLLWRRPAVFGFHRSALIACSAICVVVFWIYPVAPPRMLPGYHDVAATAVPFFSEVLESKAADQFASLPSLHVVWAIWTAIVAATLLRRRALRLAVWLYPVLTTVDVIATANHYTLDVITAPGVVLLAYTAAALLARARRPGRGPRPGRTQVPHAASVPRTRPAGPAPVEHMVSAGDRARR